MLSNLLLQYYRFAKYRDAMEAVHNFEGVLLACLILAFEEVSATSSLFDRIQVVRLCIVTLFRGIERPYLQCSTDRLLFYSVFSKSLCLCRIHQKEQRTLISGVCVMNATRHACLILT